MTEMVKIEVRVEIEGDDEVYVETPWATPLGNGRYRLENSPFYAYDLSWLDVVEAEKDPDGFLVFSRVVEKSGHRTLRAIFQSAAMEDGTAERLLNELAARGCTFEKATQTFVCIDLLPEVDLSSIVRLLEAANVEWEHADPSHERLLLGAIDQPEILDLRLIDLVVAAVNRALEALCDQPLAGFALCTDDDLVTLFGMSLTALELQASGQPGVLFEPNEWPNEIGPPFDAANRYLQLHLSEAAQTERDRAFSSLVEALASLRGSGAFEPGVFLSVLSTDPGEHLESMEERSIARLNVPAVVANWRAAAGGERSR